MSMEKAAQGGVTLIALTSVGFLFYGLYLLHQRYCISRVPVTILENTTNTTNTTNPPVNLTADEEAV